MVRIEVYGQRLVRSRMDGESLGDWQIRGEGILGPRCLCGTVSTPKGHRQSVRTGDVNRDWIIGCIRELEASAQARVVTDEQLQASSPSSIMQIVRSELQRQGLQLQQPRRQYGAHVIDWHSMKILVLHSCTLIVYG